jgi:hypothetical protein
MMSCSTRGAPPAGRPTHRRRSLLATVAVVSVAVTLGPLRPAVAGATGGGSGSAGASGRGSTIISSILWGGRTRGGSSGREVPPCAWRTLDELDVVFLVHVATSVPELQDAALFRALQPWLDGGLAPGLELQVLFCDGEPRTDQVRARPTVVGATEVATAARRQLVTRLPPPALQTSPPLGAAALVNHPVFAWVDPGQWSAPVSGTVSAGGTTVEVEAVAVALELVGGEADSGGRVVRCEGPGTPWQPSSQLSVEAQAAAPGACVLRYARLTGVQGRRSSWTGYAKLDWQGRYRVDGGPWQPLGPLFSLRIFTRSVREAPTRIEQP